MNQQNLLMAMRPEVYERLRQAVETGKWFDGSPLTEAQRETSMQAIMLYQAKVLKPDEHMTVGASGEITHKSRQQLQQELSLQQSIARFKQDDF